MTLIVGIIAKDAIVLAADSQTSYGSLKLPGTNKINHIQFKDGKGALVAESGFVSLSNQAIEFIKKQAAVANVENEEAIPMTVRAAMYAVRKEQVDLYPSGTYSLAHWKEHLRDNCSVELTVAYYFKEKPYLFNITLDECVPHFQNNYTTSGCGYDLGNYLLKEHFRPGMEYELASAIAIKITKDAATYVEGCGLPIKAALIRCAEYKLDAVQALEHATPLHLATYHPEQVLVLPPEQIAEIVAVIERSESEIRGDYLKKIHKLIEANSRKSIDRLIRSLKVKRKRKAE